MLWPAIDLQQTIPGLKVRTHDIWHVTVRFDAKKAFKCTPACIYGITWGSISRASYMLAKSKLPNSDSGLGKEHRPNICLYFNVNVIKQKSGTVQGLHVPCWAILTAVSLGLCPYSEKVQRAISLLIALQLSDVNTAWCKLMSFVIKWMHVYNGEYC